MGASGEKKKKDTSLTNTWGDRGGGRKRFISKKKRRKTKPKSPARLGTNIKLLRSPLNLPSRKIPSKGKVGHVSTHEKREKRNLREGRWVG